MLRAVSAVFAGLVVPNPGLALNLYCNVLFPDAALRYLRRGEWVEMHMKDFRKDGRDVFRRFGVCTFRTISVALSVAHPIAGRAHETTTTGGRSDAKSEEPLHAKIRDIFNEHGVQIMSPQYDEPPTPLIAPKEKWFAAPAFKQEQRKSA